ncbi:MAG: nucleoside hydrolase [Alphaproteobacteria bacterium]|nr:nucleoside hydrolase [Alphaproteobacteria bacterium]
MTTAFILDCDTGRDDALAMWYALYEDMPLKGVVASYGNTPLDNVVINCRKVLSAFPDKKIPVFTGASAPLQHHIYIDKIVSPRQEASGNGLCNIDLPYSDGATPLAFDALWAFIKATSSIEGAKLDYVITGPATNFARLLDEYGADVLSQYIGRVVMMGGKFDDLWTKLPFADFNIGADPFAVKAIMISSIPFNIVPMNATWPIVSPLDEIEHTKPRDALAEQVRDIMIAHCKTFSPEPVFRFHDPAVMVALQDNVLFKRKPLDINLTQRDDHFGQLVTADQGHDVGVFEISAVQIADFKARLLRVLGLWSV